MPHHDVSEAQVTGMTRASDTEALSLRARIGQVNQRLKGWEAVRWVDGAPRVTDVLRREVDRWGGLGALYDALLWNAASQPVRDHARALARDSARGLAPLTPSLLGRLREVVVHPHDTPDDALRALGRIVAGRAHDHAAADHTGAHKALHDRAARSLDRARLTRPGRPGPVSVRSWLGSLEGGDAAAWWDGNRPEPPHSAAYSRAVAAVDLTLDDGLPPGDGPGGLSARARAWERRAAPRLTLVLVSSWLAETARVLRAAQDGHPAPGGRG